MIARIELRFIPTYRTDWSQKLKKLIASVFLLNMLIGNVAADEDHLFVPESGFVPNEKTAIRIAEAVLFPIYGEDKIKQERPFTATLNNGIWTVIGSLPKPYTSGGTAIAKISKKDGRIIGVIHEK
jgi:hypothetical protein